jgi:putative oxidoreductase
MIESLTGTHADLVLGIARVVLGIIFFAHGAQKLLGWFSGPGLANSMRTFTEHLHLPSTLAFLVIAGEFFSGTGLIIGLFSRIAALVIALTMVGAIATVHLRFGLFLNWLGTQKGHGIEYHLLAIALALIVVVKGAGAFSLDRLVYEHFSGSERSAAAVDNDGGGRYGEDPKVGRHRPEGQCMPRTESSRESWPNSAGLTSSMQRGGLFGSATLTGGPERPFGAVHERNFPGRLPGPAR